MIIVFVIDCWSDSRLSQCIYLKEGLEMLILWAGIITVIVFFHSGKNKGENGIKWAMVGLIGYILGFSIGMLAIGETFISIFIGLAIVYFAHRLLSRAVLNKKAMDL